MRIFGMGAPELVIILLVVVLLIFGPKNLPKLGSAIGRTFKNLREGMSDDKDDEPKEIEAERDGGEAAPTTVGEPVASETVGTPVQENGDKDK